MTQYSINAFFSTDVATKTRTVVHKGADVIASGGMDDAVRIWDVTDDGELRLRHKLTDHSLGVVSVALNADVTRETIFCLTSFPFIFIRPCISASVHKFYFPCLDFNNQNEKIFSRSVWFHLSIPPKS